MCTQIFALVLPLLSLAGQGSEPPLPPERTGLIYISGFSTNNVGEYLPDGTLLRTFGAPNLTQPRGVAVDDEGNVIVVSQGSDRIFVFDLAGDVLLEVTHADLTSGTGIARSGSGEWYVGNFTPGRVLVFDAAWSWARTIESTGMNGVNCVSFDTDGKFAVTNAAQSQVHRFDAAENPLGIIQHSSLGSCMSIAMDSTGDHYVSNGTSGVVTKFDAAWNFLMTFGAGTLSAPQGIGIDEHDILTISNFSASVVHRYDTQGTLLGSFPLTGVTTGRNFAFQTSLYVLARQGTVGAASGYPERVLQLNGQTGDAMGRVQLGLSDPLHLQLLAPPGSTAPVPFALYLFAGEPGPAAATELPFDMGLVAFSTPLTGGAPQTLVNSIGQQALLGTGRLPSALAPATVLDLPAGVGHGITVTLQGLVRDVDSAGSASYSATNALVLEIL